MFKKKLEFDGRFHKGVIDLTQKHWDECLKGNGWKWIFSFIDGYLDSWAVG